MTEKSFSDGPQLLSDPVLMGALDQLIEGDERTLLDQVALTEIPAPPCAEEARATQLVKVFPEDTDVSVRLDGDTWYGAAGRIHATDEWYRNERGLEGIYRGLLTAVLVTGIS
ncbi:MAG: hypothetical protein BMS9Abin29_1428 [Gemmatimonadota bacterium]|nr:MAG: hypothetical protein BMS9Abin29_1428 [Gemmatimonadota bacterium]